MTLPTLQVLRNTTLATLVAVLAACGGTETDTMVSAVQEAAGGQRGHDLPWLLDESQLSTDALSVTRDNCDTEPYAADVRWTLQPSHGSQPQIWLASVHQDPKLWVAPSQREGGKRTGPWLSASSAIYLVDGSTDTVIARQLLSEVACGS